MPTSPMLAAPPWHWWIAVNLLIVDAILLVVLAIVYVKVVGAPARSLRHDPEVPRPSNGNVLDER